MSRKARSARGEMIDFDLIAIKQQLATTPVPVGVNQRRKFIDEKDGVKTRENFIIGADGVKQSQTQLANTEITDGPLAVASASAKKSAAAK